jgi:hypothetical protein
MMTAFGSPASPLRSVHSGLSSGHDAFRVEQALGDIWRALSSSSPASRSTQTP